VYPCGATHAATELDAYDPEAARRRMGVDRADFARIFDYIWHELVERRSLLDAAWKAGDLALVGLHAHTLKTAAATIGAEGLRRAAETLERAAAAGDLAAMEQAMCDFHAARAILARMAGLA
jgi:HPt (histidine-containing phosphotransfer) domain-containing protein